MDQSILSLPFLRPGVLVQCSNCGQPAADVYAKDEAAALAGQGVCGKCAAVAPEVPALSPVIGGRGGRRARSRRSERRAGG
jgi:hypothetical protein